MRALEQPLLAVQQLSSGIRTLRYRPLLPEDFQPLKVSLGTSRSPEVLMLHTSMHCCCNLTHHALVLQQYTTLLLRITHCNVCSRTRLSCKHDASNT
jgi:hypothetical protein